MKKAVVAGGSGMVGSRLCRWLEKNNYEVALLTTTKNKSAPFKTYFWNPQEQFIEPDALNNTSVIINLAGAGIADKRWTAKRKKELMDSRVLSASLLVSEIQKMNNKMECFLQVSASGYYEKNKDRVMNESDPPGKDFLSSVAVQWENTLSSLIQSDTRVVTLRLGVVLSTMGGMLQKMIGALPWHVVPLFGSGLQRISWIHLDDLCRMMLFLIQREQLSGVFNAVSPQVITQAELNHALRRVYSRSSMQVPVPSILLKLLFSGMASVLLDSIAVSSEKISKAGFEFQYPEIYSALRDLLSRKI